MKLLRKISAGAAQSFCFASSRDLWRLNEGNRDLPLSKRQKIMVGLYLILADYADGRFPPEFKDQQKAYDAEIASRSKNDFDAAKLRNLAMKKPFWSAQDHRLLSFASHHGRQDAPEMRREPSGKTP